MQRAGEVISRLEWIRVASVFAFVFECVFVFVVEVQRGDSSPGWTRSGRVASVHSQLYITHGSAQQANIGQ